MKNYYEILEVDKKASPEVIEKAYKTLVKKYHPDLQDGEKQSEYEEKMKIINEAYSVLTDDYKKANYDEQLQENTVSLEKYEELLQENQKLRYQLDNISPQINNNQTTINNMQNSSQRDDTISRITKIMNENIKQARAKAYNDAYEQDMKNRGYTIKYQHDLKYYLKFIGCLIIVVLVFFIIYQIPIVKRFFNQLYEENVLIQAIVDVFKKTFSSKV